MGDRLKEFADVKCVIRALLVVNNGPTRYTSLLKQYQAQEGRGIPYRRFGYVDCVSFLESLTDTVHVTRNDTDVLLSAKIGDDLCHVQTLVRAEKVRERCPTTTSPTAKMRERPSAPQLPELVESNLLHLVGENGANLRALRDVYFRRFGTSLEVEQYGFASLEDSSERLLGKPVPVATLQLMQLRFPSLFRVERCGPMGDFVLFPAADVASPQSLPPAAPLPSQSLVLVSHVRSPTEVTVQQQSDMLIELTIAMNQFYGVPDLLGKIPATGPFDASPGRLCAAFWDKGACMGEDGRRTAQSTGRGSLADLPRLRRRRNTSSRCRRNWTLKDSVSVRGDTWNSRVPSVDLNVVRLGTRRYIFSVDLSRLLGWSRDTASQELERRGIHFEQVQLRRGRDEDSWRAWLPSWTRAPIQCASSRPRASWTPRPCSGTRSLFY
ncbi:hypothetical protein HPB49_004311 [Dermacentor silvarum]|uniref:Uncharacterized protein n=1 Tax=Dermacentor silvarum TaxID=543639 RepID=A0ACB8DUM7_DERSI|nr:hypothetical protein HPB49_004311 [Dermacentor silvarum]